MIWRILLRTVITICILIILFVAFLFTPTGFRASVYVGTKFLPGKVHYERLYGMLTGPVYLENFTYDDKKTHIGVKKLHIDWSLTALLGKHVHIKELNASGITFISPQSAKQKAASKKPFNLKTFIQNIKFDRLSIPYDIRVDNALITDIKYGYSKDDLRAYVKNVAFNGIISNEKINFHAKADIIKPENLTVRLDTTGTLKHYALALQVTNDKYALNLAGVGSDHNLKAHISNTHLLGGDLTGDIFINWYPKLEWNAHLIGKSLDIATIQRLMMEKLVKPNPDAPALPKTISFDIATTGDKQAASVSIHSLEILNGTLSGQLSAKLDNSYPWSLKLKAKNLDLNDARGLLPENSPLLKNINPDGTFLLSTEFSAHGDTHQANLHINMLKLLGGSIMGDATITLHPLNWTASLKGSQLDINKILSLLPSDNTFAQKLNPQGDFKVGFDITAAKSDKKITLQLHTLNIMNGTIHGHISAELNDTLPWSLALAGKNLEISTLNNLIPDTVDVSAKSKTSHIINFNITGSGTKDNVKLKINHTQIFKGHVNANLIAVLKPTLKWDLHLSADKLDLTPIKHFLPKDINLLLKTKGEMPEHTLPNFDLNGKLTSGKSHVNVILSHHEIWNGQWDISIPKLKALLPNATGSIHSKGTLKGTIKKPETTGNIDVKHISYGNTFSIKSILGKWQLYLDQDRNSFADITASHLAYNTMVIPQVQITAKGKMSNHGIAAHIKLKKDNVAFAAKGRFDGTSWSGEITKFGYSDKVLGPWHLSKPTEIFLSPNKISVASTCIISNQRGQICFGGNWAAKHPWAFFLRSHGIRFTHLQTTQGLAIKLTSTLTVNAKAKGEGSQIQNAKLYATLLPGTLRYLVDTRVIRTPIRKSELVVNINPKVGLKSNLDFETGTNDKILLNASIPDFLNHAIAFKDKVLTSTVYFRIHDFRFVTIFENVLKISLGVVEGQFKIDGPLGDIKYEGNATVHLPHFEYTTVDLKANNLLAKIHANNKRISFTATGYALNKKPVTMDGFTDLTGKDIITKFVIKCNDALLIYNNEMKVYADAIMNFLLNPTTLTIDGKIHIPRAQLTPKGFGSGEETVPQNDIVYIGLPKKDEPKPTGHKIHLKLHITLGDNVLLKVMGLRANLEGGLTMSMTPDRGTLGNGQIRVMNGTFQRFGQYLVVENGSSVSYSDTPMASPALDIRAYKYVNTTSESIGTQSLNTTIKVGVQVYGTPEQIKFKLFSQPPNISQADILSYLVLGYANNNANAGSLSVLLDAANAMLDSGGGLDRPPGFTDRLKQGLGITELGIRNESVLDALGNPVEQQSSFVVGQKLTRRLYIQYSRGIIIPDNEFSVQYRLNPNWRIQTTAGTMGVGADVLYQLSTD